MPIYGSCYMELFNEPTPDRHVGMSGGHTHTTTDHIAESRPLAVAKLYQEAYEVRPPDVRISLPRLNSRHLTLHVALFIPACSSQRRARRRSNKHRSEQEIGRSGSGRSTGL